MSNKHTASIALRPQKGLGEKKTEALAAKLSEYKGTLSDSEIDKLIEDNAKLREKQLSPDSEEALATIPKLEVSDVDPKVEIIPQDVEQRDAFTLLHHDIFFK